MEQFEGFVDISPENEQGVLKKIIKEGTGVATPITGAKVFVHYTGTLCGGEKDGEQFDSSRGKEKFSFTLGEGQVIKAWDIGVATMKKNEICELICKPDFAYGSKATGSIPANSTLKFEVELFSWQGKDISPNKDGAIIQTILSQGTGFESPKDCVLVKLSIKGSYNEKVFDERDVEFEIGDCVSSNVISGIEIAVKKMKKAEKSSFEIEAAYAFGKNGSKEWDIPANAMVVYEIQLKEFENVKESYSLDLVADKFQYAENFKIRATERFQNNNFLYASKLYEKAVSYVEYESDLNDEEKAKRNILFLTLKLNLALCFLKLGDHVKSIVEVDKALEIDPKNEKGLFRKGKALQLKGDFEDAKIVFQNLIAEYPSNKQGVSELKICDVKIREHLNMEKKLYQSMFSKIGEGKSGHTKLEETKPEEKVAAL